MILLAHNRYRSTSPSGENIAVDRLAQLLEKAGKPAETWLLDSDDFLAESPVSKLRLAWRLSGCTKRQRAFAERLVEYRDRGVSLIHLHNPWPGFTYDLAIAANTIGLPVVQTLHNYRLLGTNSHFVVDGSLRRVKSIEEKLHVQRMANNHGSAANLFYNRALKEWWEQSVPQHSVAAYICLTHFQRQLATDAGLPEDRCFVVHNFLDHEGAAGDGVGDDDGAYALFVGRLDQNKGVDWLYRWWPLDGPRLLVVGSGPLESRLGCHPRIKLLGAQPFLEVQRLLSCARLLVMPSTCYEGMPLVLVEALAAGTPSLVTALGGMPGIIGHGETGTVMPPPTTVNTTTHNVDQLARDALRDAWDAAPSQREACRARYLAHFTPNAHLKALDTLYNRARRS